MHDIEMQITQQDFQKKLKSGWTGKGSLVLEVPLCYFASQHNLFHTMWPDRAKGLLFQYWKLVKNN